MHDGCHFVSFVMYISGAKFKEHCFNISRDILDWVLNCFSGTTYDVITYNTKTWISLKRKKMFQKGKRHSSLLWKAFQISNNYVLLHRHFKREKRFPPTSPHLTEKKSSFSETNIRDLTHIRRRRPLPRPRRGRRLVKNVFLFFFGISHLFGTIQCACRF